jgi:hypothetical protein
MLDAELCFPVAGVAAGALDEGRRPNLSWCDNDLLAEHRFALTREGVRRSTIGATRRLRHRNALKMRRNRSDAAAVGNGIDFDRLRNCD